MADTLIAKLSNSREIIVSSLNSVRKYGGLEQDASAAGRELQVNSVLEGNIQKVGDRIRVSARVINVSDGASLWAGTFDEKFTDVFAVQDAISQKVADALALRLNQEENKRLIKRYTDNVEAYQLHLTGRYHWSKLTPPDIRKGIGFLQQAIDLDPDYALAYAGLATANRALALDPNSAMSHFAYAHILSDQGHHPEAIAEIGRARELDPVFLLIRALEGMILHHAGRNDEALTLLQKALELDPNLWVSHLMLGKVYTQQRKYPEAIAEFTTARELSHGNSEAIGSIGYVEALAGEKEKARAVLEELKTLSNQRYIP